MNGGLTRVVARRSWRIAPSPADSISLKKESHGLEDDVEEGAIPYEKIDRCYRIESVNEDGKVDFQNGSVVYADAIIHCTRIFLFRLRLGVFLTSELFFNVFH